MPNKELKNIDGTLLQALRKGAVIVAEAATIKDVLILTKNPSGSEWTYSEFVQSESEPFITYAEYNHSKVTTLRNFYEDQRTLKKLATQSV